MSMTSYLVTVELVQLVMTVCQQTRTPFLLIHAEILSVKTKVRIA